MRKVVLITAFAVVLALLANWLVSELIWRAAGLYYKKLVMDEPFFTKVVLRYRHCLLLIAIAWVLVTGAIWKWITLSIENSFLYLALGALLLVLIQGFVAIACILPWLPRGGPFK